MPAASPSTRWTKRASATRGGPGKTVSGTGVSAGDRRLAVHVHGAAARADDLLSRRARLGKVKARNSGEFRYAGRGSAGLVAEFARIPGRLACRLGNRVNDRPVVV